MDTDQRYREVFSSLRDEFGAGLRGGVIQGTMCLRLGSADATLPPLLVLGVLPRHLIARCKEQFAND